MYFRMMPFFDIHISQDTIATRLKRGGIVKHEFVANLLPNPLVKKNENRIGLVVGEVMAKSLVSCFLTHGVVIPQNSFFYFQAPCASQKEIEARTSLLLPRAPRTLVTQLRHCLQQTMQLEYNIDYFNNARVPKFKEVK